MKIEDCGIKSYSRPKPTKGCSADRRRRRRRVCNKYENHFSNKLKGHEEMSNIKVQWKSIIRVMTKVTEKVTGEREIRYNDDECIRKIRTDRKC